MDTNNIIEKYIKVILPICIFDDIDFFKINILNDQNKLKTFLDGALKKTCEKEQAPIINLEFDIKLIKTRYGGLVISIAFKYINEQFNIFICLFSNIIKYFIIEENSIKEVDFQKDKTCPNKINSFLYVYKTYGEFDELTITNYVVYIIDSFIEKIKKIK